MNIYRSERECFALPLGQDIKVKKIHYKCFYQDVRVASAPSKVQKLDL